MINENLVKQEVQYYTMACSEGQEEDFMLMRPVGDHEKQGFHQIYDYKHPGEVISKMFC